MKNRSVALNYFMTGVVSEERGENCHILGQLQKKPIALLFFKTGSMRREAKVQKLSY
jgi:hypothetical protein